MIVMSALWARSALIVMAGLFCIGESRAETYPSRPIRIVCPFPAGGGTDVVARTVAQYLALDNGWNVVVENRGGANGTLGLGEIARARPDGHELVIGISDSAIFAPLFNKLSFDTVRDLTPIAIVATTPLLITSSAQGNYTSFKQIMEQAKAKPGTLTLGSNGRGSATHVAYELMKIRTGLDLRHVPYRGSAASAQDLVGGHIDLVGSSIASTVPLVRSGNLRALAVTGPQRNSSLPDVPTMRELSIDVELTVWMGLFGPPNMPAEVVERLHASVGKLVAKPQVKDALAAQGLDVAMLAPGEFGALVKKDASFWRDIGKRAGIEAE